MTGTTPSIPTGNRNDEIQIYDLHKSFGDLEVLKGITTTAPPRAEARHATSGDPATKHAPKMSLHHRPTQRAENVAPPPPNPASRGERDTWTSCCKTSVPDRVSLPDSSWCTRTTAPR